MQETTQCKVKGAVRRALDGGSLREPSCFEVRSPCGWHGFLWCAVFTHERSCPRVEPGKQSFLHDLATLTEPSSTVTSHCPVPPPPELPGPRLSSVKTSLCIVPACRPHPTLAFLLSPGLAGLCCAHSKSLGCSSVTWCLMHRDNMSCGSFQLSSWHCGLLRELLLALVCPGEACTRADLTALGI